MASYVTKTLSNVPIYTLIAEPLKAACEAQKDLATTLSTFISEVGMNNDDGVSLKYVEFSCISRHGCRLVRCCNGQ